LTLAATNTDGSFSAKVRGASSSRSPGPSLRRAESGHGSILLFARRHPCEDTRVGRRYGHGTRKGLDLSGIEGSAQIRKLEFTYGDLRIENEDRPTSGSRGARPGALPYLAGPGTRLAVTGSTQLERMWILPSTGCGLSLLRVLFREVDHSDGTASVRITISDAWSNPEIAGELNIRDGLIKIRDIPRSSPRSAYDQLYPDKVVTEGLSERSAGGPSHLRQCQLDGSSLVDFSTKASMENVTVRYPAGLTATVGGVLYYDGDASAQILSGEILLRRARYEKRVDWKSMLVDFSRDSPRRRRRTLDGSVRRSSTSGSSEGEHPF